MSHFEFMSGIDDCLSAFDAPIVHGPVPRWQRKSLGKKIFCGSVPLSPYNDSRTTKTPIRTPRKCKTPLKTPRKTPQKTPAKTTPPLVDRFIPNRATMYNDKNYFQLVNDIDSEMQLDQIGPENLEKFYYQKTMKDNLEQAEDASESRILHFQHRAPEPREGYRNNLRVLYCQNKGSTTRTSRYIPRDPEKILDAPGLLNDFYLNLVDWGSNNCVAISLDETVYIWNATTMVSKNLLKSEQQNYVSSISWIKEGNVLAVGCHNGYIQLWDVEQGKCLRTMTGHCGRVGSLSWNSHILSGGCRSGVIYNHDVRIPNHLMFVLRDHTQDVCGLSWSPDGKLLASGGNDNIVNVWSPLTVGRKPIHSLRDHSGAIKAVSWCPWQLNVLATGGGALDHHIRFWNATSGLCLNSIDVKSQVSSILWSKEHRELITAHGYALNQLSIWRYPSMVRIADLTGHSSRVLYTAMSPCGEYVASAGADETLRIWKCFEHDQMKKKNSASLPLKSSTTNFSMINKIR